MCVCVYVLILYVLVFNLFASWYCIMASNSDPLIGIWLGEKSLHFHSLKFEILGPEDIVRVMQHHLSFQDPGVPWRCQGLESSGDIGHIISLLRHTSSESFRKCVDSFESVRPCMAERKLSSNFWLSLFADTMIPEFLCLDRSFLCSLGTPHRTSSFVCFPGQFQGWRRDRITTVLTYGQR